MKNGAGYVEKTPGQMSPHSECAVPKAVLPEGKESCRKAVPPESQKQQLLRLQILMMRDCRNPDAQNRLLQTLGNTDGLPLHREYSSTPHQLFLNVKILLILPLC